MATPMVEDTTSFEEDQLASMSTEDIIRATRLLDNEIRILKVQAVVKKYDILFIADEVICAFGRLGKMFGCDKCNIKPDLVSLAKALSSAYMPIGAILMSQEVADVIYKATSLVQYVEIEVEKKIDENIKHFISSIEKHSNK